MADSKLLKAVEKKIIFQRGRTKCGWPGTKLHFASNFFRTLLNVALHDLPVITRRGICTTKLRDWLCPKN